MNYVKIYDDLVNQGKLRNNDSGVYFERHHIIPRCIGGNNSPDNLVYLTAREHFIAHMLLAKIYSHEPKLLYALNMMTLKYTEHRSKNVLYGIWKEKLAVAMSIDRRGEKNHFFGKTHTADTKDIISQKAKQRLPATPDTIAKQIESRKGYSHSSETKEKLKDAYYRRIDSGNPMLTSDSISKMKKTKAGQSLELKQKGGRQNKGKIRSDEVRAKLSKVHKGLVDGEKNPMYGKMWITDGTHNTTILKSDGIPNGYYKGRTIVTKIKT